MNDATDSGGIVALTNQQWWGGSDCATLSLRKMNIGVTGPDERPIIVLALFTFGQRTTCPPSEGYATAPRAAAARWRHRAAPLPTACCFFFH